ncbi:hypothetical protein CCMSSC00406_0006859 [Pleurotus cornucopiae]|uniref:Uncharacterized protein n=1 Tax=Pleurotus cornucopiae TaxID=5321 RepID=A0ACB7IQR2_PLECO|nr:hypothetical protein CCMSSC00406_0006859 [Pleurotus cornucopiae]
MPLSDCTLHPLVSQTFHFSFVQDHQFHTTATRYVPKARSNENGAVKYNFVFSNGISLGQETALPLIKELYRLTAGSNEVYIHSVWVVERPNHGDAAKLNEEVLKHYVGKSFPGRIPGAAIRTFLASDILQPGERENLVGVAHSGGGGSMINALGPSKQHLPLCKLILVESPHIEHAAWGPLLQLYDVVKRSNSRRPTRWASTEDAMKWFKTHIPWKNFHPDVLQVIAETYFMPDPQYTGMITTKTPVEQETACFLDDGTNLNELPYLRSIMNFLPTHLILGDVMDIWPKPIYKMISKNIAEDRPKLASITTIVGAGHYLPVERPKELAREILRILCNRDTAPRPSRL